VEGLTTRRESIAVRTPLADLAERRVTTPLVIEHLDVVEQGLLGVGVALETLALFALDGREPAFHHGVVVAITPTTHRTGDAVLLEPCPIILAGVRAALIGVMQEAGVRTPPLHRLVEGTEGQVTVIHGTERPADDEPGMQIHDDRQIELGAAADEKLSGVADPTLIRPLGRESAIEDITGDRLIVINVV
jgi:hypothetical protein